MAPKLRARPQAISDTESTHSGQDRASESGEDPTGRRKRVSKSKAMRNKIWAKIVRTQSQSRNRQENEPHPAPSSQLESKCQKLEDAMDDDAGDMALMCRPPPKKRVSWWTQTTTRAPRSFPTQAQPSEKARGISRAAPTPVQVHAEDAGFADEEDDHSDPEMGAADEEDEPGEEADDLQGLAADEVPQWSSSNTNDEDSLMFSRPSSRASFSSGHYSVPESNFDPIEVSSDSDSSNSNPAMRGALSGMKAARERLPVPVKTTATSCHESQQPAKASSAPKPKPYPRLDLTKVPPSARGRTSAPQKPVGKREAQRAQERPEWNDPQPSVSHASGQRSRSRHHSTTIKHEYADPVHVKAEPEDGIFTSTGGSGDFSLRKNSRGTLNLTKQHPDVQNVLGLAIDYFLGFTFGNSVARGRGLSTVLFGRIRIWHGKVKAATHQVVYGHYQAQHDCAGLVTRLLDKQSFIYPHKADKIDPRTHEVTHGKPDKRRPYEHKGVPAVASCFFKGPNSIAERVEAMFKPLNQWLRFPVPVTVDDYSTGEHKPTDFEGSRVQDAYEVHIMILQKLEAEHPEQYHTMMENIFNVASRGSSFAKGTKAPLTLLQQEALSMLDWSD
ncbi:hypothetical protein B0H14DRAFT_3442746 [Mycena olivaceomarginata]|nr:hypothetical protein B0H14DRAFT_3442746 [Mycena olivaceomarginata]